MIRVIPSSPDFWFFNLYTRKSKYSQLRAAHEALVGKARLPFIHFVGVVPVHVALLHQRERHAMVEFTERGDLLVRARLLSTKLI